MTYVYLRQMQNNSPLSDQQRIILSFSLTNNLQIDKEVVEYSSKNHAIEERKQFEEFLHSLCKGDMILVETLAILSSRVGELIKVIHCLISREVDLFVADSNLRIDKDTSIKNIFPLLDNLREKHKAKSGQIGRPKGSRSQSKFDTMRPRIMAMLKENSNVSAIARELGVSRSSLKDYIQSRGLKELTDGAWLEIELPPADAELEDALLICPFEQEKPHTKGETINAS